MFENENHLNGFYGNDAHSGNGTSHEGNKLEHKPIAEMNLEEVNHALSQIESRILMGRADDADIAEKENLLIRKEELE